MVKIIGVIITAFPLIFNPSERFLESLTITNGSEDIQFLLSAEI